MICNTIKSKSIKIISLYGDIIKKSDYGKIGQIVYENIIVYSLKTYINNYTVIFSEKNDLDSIPDNSIVTGIIEDLYKVTVNNIPHLSHFSDYSRITFYPSLLYYFLRIRKGCIVNDAILFKILNFHKNNETIMDILFFHYGKVINKIIENCQDKKYDQYLDIVNRYKNNKKCLPFAVTNDVSEFNISVLIDFPELVDQITNKTLILEVLKYNVLIYQYLSDDLSKDTDIIFQAIKYNHTIIPTILNKYKMTDISLTNDEFIMKALEYNSLSLQYLQNINYSYHEKILDICQKEEQAYRFIPYSFLLKNRNILLKLISNCNLYYRFDQNIIDKYCDDKEIILLFTKKTYLNILQHVSDNLRNDEEIILAVIKEKNSALQYIPEHFLNNKNFILKGVSVNKFLLERASYDIRNDKELMLKVVSENNNVFLSVSDNLRNDKQVVFAAVNKNPESLAYVSNNIYNDRNFLLELIEQNYLVLKHVSDKFLDDRNFILEAIKNNPKALSIVPYKFSVNKQFMVEVINTNYLLLKYIPEYFNVNKHFLLEVIKNNPISLKYISANFLNDKQFLLEAIESNAMALKYVPIYFYHDKQFILSAVNVNGLSIKYAGETFRIDEDVMLTASNNNCLALNYMFNNEEEKKS